MAQMRSVQNHKRGNLVHSAEHTKKRGCNFVAASEESHSLSQKLNKQGHFDYFLVDLLHIAEEQYSFSAVTTFTSQTLSSVVKCNNIFKHNNAGSSIFDNQDVYKVFVQDIVYL